MNSIRRACGLLALLAAGSLLRAQEPWEGGFKLSAGQFSGAEDAYLGQGRAFGVALFGTYPLGSAGQLAFDAGYKFLPTTVHVVGSSSWEDKTDGYYGTAQYRHRLFFEGFQLQAGLRLSQYATARRANFYPGDGSSVLTKSKGAYATTLKPVLGAAYRLNEKYGLELNLAPTEMKNVAGEAKTGTLLELSLVIHL